MGYGVGMATYCTVFAGSSFLMGYSLSNHQGVLALFALVGMVWSTLFMTLLLTNPEQ